MQRQLLLLLNLELFNQLESSGLVVAHVLVPGFREFCKLQLLGALDVHQFLLLSQAHVLLLTLLFGARELLKPQLHHLGARVVATRFGIDAKLVHDPIINEGQLVKSINDNLPQEGKDFVIWKEVNSRLGQQRSIATLILLIHLNGLSPGP